jgi:hypothetical protein
MILAVLLSTLSVLRALDTGRRRWWVLYAVSACTAFWAHYTCLFVLGAQAAWVLWQRPDGRRPLLIATGAAIAGAVPWAPGLINDLHSPTIQILKALSPFTVTDIRIDLTHWVIGFPETFAGSLTALPGIPALLALAAGVLIVAGTLAARAGTAGATGGRARLAALRAPGDRPAGEGDHRLLLIAALAVATPVCELVLGALGDSVFSVRDLGASWPYLALAVAGVLTMVGGRPALAAGALGLVAFALGAATMLTARFQRPDYQSAAAYVERIARPGDVVVDETGALSPGPLTGLDVSLSRPPRIFRAQAPAERSHPYGLRDPIIGLQSAVDAAVRAAAGHRVLLVTNTFVTDIVRLAVRTNPAPSQFPRDYRLVAERSWSGLGGTLVAVYADVAAARR